LTSVISVNGLGVDYHKLLKYLELLNCWVRLSCF